jgi:hypothetical protein
MTYAAKVIADSIADDVRLTTMEVTFPRIVLAEFNTHRMFSRNSASSRAIPVEKRIQAVIDDPFVPESFGSNQRGMQAGSPLEGHQARKAHMCWLEARDKAVESAAMLAELGVHKQLANRLIEPFSWHTVVVTATEWENYFALRCSSLAQPEIRIVSEMMESAMAASNPHRHNVNGWHLPYVYEEDYAALSPLHHDDLMPMVSAARCARVSYLTHDGRRDVEEDLALAERLSSARHMSPFEHAARVVSTAYTTGKFVGDIKCEPRYEFGNFRAPWLQLRKLMRGEAVAPREVA